MSFFMLPDRRFENPAAEAASNLPIQKSMKAIIQPYLFFEGCCEQAVDFYCEALGAKRVMLMRYKDSPDEPPPGMVAPGSEEKIMHAAFRIGDSLVMASDNCCAGKSCRFDGFSLSLTLPGEGEARQAFEALADGGEVMMPLMKTFWSPCFGMVTDRFGVGWMVTVEESV
jgi:PhnB protein